MLLRDLGVLARHYGGLFGTNGWPLTADRALRSKLPAGLYRTLAHLTWLRGRGRNFSLRADNVPFSDTRDDSVPDAAHWFSSQFPGTVDRKVRAGDQICNHTFDFLGTGPRHWGDPIDWDLDIKSGYRWPQRFYLELAPVFNTTDPTDAKIPYELSRLHHFVTLGQAWSLTGDERYAATYFSQWEGWTESNPWPYGVNWTSAMEAGIRAVNLIWAACLLHGAPGWTHERRMALDRTLWEHGRFIEHNLEVGVRDGDLVATNHYLANLFGLAYLGLCGGEGADATRWARAGLKGLEQEIHRQVLPDGFFFESSTSYHRLAVELFLLPALLARRLGHEMSDAYWQQLERMLEVVLHTTGPDGRVPQIGDDDDGRALILSGYPDWPRHDHRYLLAIGAVLFERGDFKSASLPSSSNVPGAEESGGPTNVGCPEEVFWLLGGEGVEQFDALPKESSPIHSRGFPNAGIYVVRSEDNRDYALVRTASQRSPVMEEPNLEPSGQMASAYSEGLHSIPAGPLPTGHGHNDALSFELWLAGQPVFIDSGTFCYTSDMEARNLSRSTAAHNTVEIDGREISRIPPHKPFRLEWDARVTVQEWHVGREEIRLVAARDGYGRLETPVRHRRGVRYDTPTRVWKIADELKGDGEHTAVFRWNSPHRDEIDVLEVDSLQLQLTTPTASMVVAIDNTTVLDWSHGLQATSYSPSYGVSKPATRLWVSVRFDGQFSLSWRVSPREIFTGVAPDPIRRVSAV